MDNIKKFPIAGEEWRDIPGLEGSYQASSFGRVRSLDRSVPSCASKTRIVRPFARWVRGKVLSPALTSAGYLAVGIKRDGRSLTTSVHRLVAVAFIDNPHGLPCVNHKNGNKLDNSVSNLEWCSYAQNTEHSISTGLHIPARGERAGGAVLTETKVREIRKLLAAGMSQRQIAAQYGVAQKTIGGINTGRNWGHVK